MNEGQAAGSPSSWTVTGQVQQSGQDSRGQYVSGWLVTYRTGNGVQGQVFIPEAEYNVDNVRAVIMRKVNEHAGIAGLSG